MGDLFTATLQVTDTTPTEINKAVLDLLTKINKVAGLAPSSGFNTQIPAGKNVRTQILAAGSTGLFSAAAGALDTPEGPGPSSAIWYFLYSGDRKNGSLFAWNSQSGSANEWSSVLSTQAANPIWTIWVPTIPSYITNSSGNAVKLGDGTLIQFGNGTAPVYSGSSTTFVFPIGFLDGTFSITTTFKQSGASISGTSDLIVTAFATTGFTVTRQNNGNLDAFSQFSWIAIGRWK